MQVGFGSQQVSCQMEIALALVISCLVSAGGLRDHTSVEQVQSSLEDDHHKLQKDGGAGGLPHPLKSLEMLLVALNPAAGWQATGSRLGQNKLARISTARSAGQVHMIKKREPKPEEDDEDLDDLISRLEAKLPSSPNNDALPKLPKCTIAVAGANGRTGSWVCRYLLRNHPEVTVRALVRDATSSYQGYGRLSFVVGAEEGKGEIKPAWYIDEEDGRIMKPATMTFDPERQGGYGLDRLEVRECELRYEKDVDLHLGDVDAIIYCASTFNVGRVRLPENLKNAGEKISKAGMAFFELRWGDMFEQEDDDTRQRREESEGTTADDRGVALAVKALEKKVAQKAKLSALTGTDGASKDLEGLAVPFVLLSSAVELGRESQPGTIGTTIENDFGVFKRMGETELRESSVPHVIVRSATVDETMTPFDLPVSSEESPADKSVSAETINDWNQRRINPRDLARFAIDCLRGQNPEGKSKTVEAWTDRQTSPLRPTEQWEYGAYD